MELTFLTYQSNERVRLRLVKYKNWWMAVLDEDEKYIFVILATSHN
jgi:hypothetical protein